MISRAVGGEAAVSVSRQWNGVKKQNYRTRANINKSKFDKIDKLTLMNTLAIKNVSSSIMHMP